MAFIINPNQTVESLGGDLSGRAEQSYITCIADTGVYDVQTLTFDATANINQAEFFVLTNQAGTDYAVWFDIDANGTTPTGAAYGAVDAAIEVDITTGQTAAQVAAAVEIALGATANMSFDDTAADGTMTVTQDKIGVTTAVVWYDADSTAYSGGGALAVAATTVGVASNLQNKYVTFRSGSNSAFNCWFNVGSEGSDPSAGGTALTATMSAGAAATAVATAIALAINNNANFEAEADGARVKITNAAEGVATNIGAGNSTFTVAVQADGYAAWVEPSTSPASISNNPSA